LITSFLGDFIWDALEPLLPALGLDDLLHDSLLGPRQRSGPDVHQLIAFFE